MRREGVPLPAAQDHHIYQFDLLASNTLEPLATYAGHSTQSFYVKLGLSCDGRFLASGSSDASAYIWKVDTPGLPQLRLAGHRAEVAVLAWDTFHPARLATCGDDNRVLLWDAAGAEEEGSSMQDCTRAEVFAAPESAETRAGASPSLARFLPPHYPACSARTPTRTSSSMADWFTPPTKRRLTSVTSTTPGSLDHSTCSEGVVTLPDGKSLSPPAEAVLSPRKKVDNAANLPQRRLLPCLNALEDDIKKDAGATGLTTCDLENQPLQMQETPPRPVASEVMPSPPSASHSRKQHKIMTRLFKKQAASAVDKGKSKAKRALLNTQQQITAFFKR
ncbi:denticleless protein homolog [Rhipicephalus sanguineus]|uniref:denticleless protein homolog n=1 Tax=Rhipicephalus sanguineus TaxID=34632 RepID=UPI0020C1D33F|nr:denticleless protein homolog [Rhipicephalus sanguineus]